MRESSEDEAAASVTTARIAHRVHTLRQQRGLSLEALAQRCNVSKSMISLIERGESSPTAVVLERLAVGLGVALASLFDDDAAPPSRSSTTAVGLLSPRSIKEIIDLLTLQRWANASSDRPRCWRSVCTRCAMRAVVTDAAGS